MDLRKKRKPMKFLDGYRKITDGYTENPFAHGENATTAAVENEYFMQWVYPLKLNRIALRTPTGFRIVYGRAKDVWNNRFKVHIPEDDEISKGINKKLIPYLKSRRWFREMQKLTAFKIEQGEGILLKYYKDEGNVNNYENPVNEYAEILKVEAFNPINYHIPSFDKFGNPAMYRITVKSPDKSKGLITVPVHPSRVLRKTANNIEYRFTGYSDLAVVYDSIVILGTILKASGEAAFRWGTGHPTIFTKDLFTEADLTKLKDSIGDFTRRSWHMIPSEYVEKIDLLGQAGSMLNLKSLADIALDQVIIGTAMPRPILLGEVAGVISGSEVNERSWFAILDEDHTDLEDFVRMYFKDDINVQKILNGFEDDYEIDWGIREVLNKMDGIEYEQKQISNALALTQIITIDESRQRLGYEPIGEETGGNMVLGLQPVYLAEMQMAMMASQPQTNTNYDQSVRGTEKKQASTKGDLEKNKKLSPKMDSILKLRDAFNNVQKHYSVNEFSDSMEIYPKTFNKLNENIKKLLKQKKE